MSCQDWKDFLFPIIKDIREINDETNTNRVAENNLELSKDFEKYSQFIQEILKKKASTNNRDNNVITSTPNQ
jgi:hypothetical protein